ncbi:MAG TPA: 1-deoxy-D-xylulose-5-phosphate synthase [Clostridiaceae bacterium]|nr:1-deoxy-D-xylulose-5-phosphate synthase [Clostridiaceae bacterium]
MKRMNASEPQVFPAPEAIPSLSLDAMTEVAAALRQRIVDQVAAGGGHLASNLGLVELTLALLHVFNFPADKIVFDVGHQCYAWKLLTGRADRFHTLRKKGGLAGFPKRSESPFDAFETGHSSTSVSAAAGIARANRLQGRDDRVIALIGDGALSGGMAFEAMNDVGHGEDNLLVILNDNQMSIAKGVGGLARHLEKVRLSRRYRKLKSTVETRMEKLGGFGRGIASLLRAVKRVGRSLVSRGQVNVYFEELGFRYYGPVDGHDLAAVIDHLKHVRDIPGPVLLHVETVKGKGYEFAESEPSAYHGVAPFIIENGVCRTKPPCVTFSEVFGGTLTSLAAGDERIVAISAAMTDGTGLRPFLAAYPDRFFDVGIAEQHAVTLAAGFAAAGMRPFVALYSTFLQRAVDQLIHDVCLQNLPVVFAIDRAGAVGADGPTHQGYYDLALAKLPPNLHVFAPQTEGDLRLLLETALLRNGPSLIRYPRSQVPDAAIERRDVCEISDHGGEGKTVILSLGALFEEVREAVGLLREEGIGCRHISTMCINPINFDGMMELLNSADVLYIVEDGARRGGAGESIACGLADRGFDGKIICLGHTELTRGQASRDELLREEGLDARGIWNTVRKTSRPQQG